MLLPLGRQTKFYTHTKQIKLIFGFSKLMFRIKITLVYLHCSAAETPPRRAARFKHHCSKSTALPKQGNNDLADEMQTTLGVSGDKTNSSGVVSDPRLVY
jgi:hypothetical protein